MPLNTNIRSIHITARFGATPSFEVSADEGVTTVRSKAEFSQFGAGNQFEPLLREVLRKVEAAYNSQRSITLCVDGKEIKQEANCP